MRTLCLAARLTVFAFLALGFAACEKERPALVADASSTRTTPSGTVIGGIGEYDNHVWLGIPYAKPPVGELRWRAPRPADPWTGTRDALHISEPCTQYFNSLASVSASPGDTIGSEDCLYLNIYAPRFTPESVPKGGGRLPVMLWIHGGGNTTGEASSYNGGNLAVSQDVIVVTINYRLGPLGWFRNAALHDSNDSDLDRSGNYGTLDIIRALEWVRDNIAAFGGDPQRVTIFGESAGAVNVYSLLVSPPAAGLFHRAIAQSGRLKFSDWRRAERLTTDPFTGDANSSGEATVSMMLADGTAADRAAAEAHLRAMSPADLERYLRGKTNYEILAAYKPDKWSGMFEMPEVFREGVVIPDDVALHLLTKPSLHHDVPLMTGTTRDENKLFMFTDPEWVSRTLWIFPRLRDERMYNLTAEYNSKYWRAVGTDEPARALSTQQSSVYSYRFDWDEEPTILGADLSVMIGAAHLLDVPFVFGHFDLGKEGNVIFTTENEAGRKELSAKMMSYWAAFAADGAPGQGRRGELTEWKAYDIARGGKTHLILDTEAGGGTQLAPGALLPSEIIASVATDPRLETQKDRCTVLRSLTKWSEAMTPQHYASSCPKFPMDEFPWD